MNVTPSTAYSSETTPRDPTTRDLKLNVSEKIRQLAQREGFQRVGLLPLQALEGERQRLQDWLSAGHHAGMDWMTRHLALRLDPAGLLPGAQSVVCVAINYYPGEILKPESAQAKIARYAVGTDYHKLIRRKLRRILSCLQADYPELDIQGRAFCDSAPLLERVLAEQAGIGWRGKHGLMITPSVGSWVFLGELLLTIALESTQNEVAVDRCGRCTRCIDACPTAAILPTRSVDAQKCLAYWTIEHQGETPEEPLPDHIAQHQQGWVFGCDICQEVCPWNLKLATPTLIDDWQHPDKTHAPVDYWFTMSEADFQKTFGQTPLRRTGLRRIQRNARSVKTTLNSRAV